MTREADDTSLGAELLEEIYPGTDDEGAIETQAPSGLDAVGEHSSSIMSMEPQAEPLVSYARAVEVYDPASGAFGAALVIPLLFLVYLGFVTASGALGFQPKFMSQLSQYNHYVWGGGLVATGVVALIGYMVTGQSKTSGKPKSKKPRPEKKGKKKK